MNQFFLSSEIFRGSSYGNGHPLDVPRVWPVMDLCHHFHWLNDEEYISVPPATPEELGLFHTADYISALQDAEAEQSLSDNRRLRHNIGQAGNPIYPEIYSRPATAAKASILGAELLASGKAHMVFNPSGGTHHGRADEAFGFCFVNDPVLGLLTLHHKGAGRVAYIDLDAHHGDGVQDAVSHMPHMRVFSVHEAGRWPRTGQNDDKGGGYAFNYTLPRGAIDKDLISILNASILPEIRRFKPDVIVLQAGSDGLESDPQSGLSYSIAGYWRAVEACLAYGAPTMILGGGGYNPISTAKAWTGLWGLIKGENPYEKMLDEVAAKILRGLKFPHRLGRNMPETWFTQLGD